MSAPVSRRRRGLEIGLSVLALVVVFVVAEGLFREKVGPGEPVDETAAAPPAATVLAESRDIPVVTEATGSVRPVQEARLGARVQGVVTDVRVRVGDRVRAGELLVTLSAPELASAAASAQGGVAAAEARLAQARRDLARNEALAARDAATRVEVEQSQTAVAMAEGDLARARQAARGERQLADYQELRAPFDGLVTERHADPGDLAQPGTRLLAIGDDSRWRVEATFDERAAAGLGVGSSVQAHVDALSLTVDARIAEMEPGADPSTRTLLVKADLPEAAGLRPGLFARLGLATGARPGVVVPAHAVRRVGGLQLVRVLAADGRVASRHVRTGETLADGTVEVLSGLAAGERLVAEAP